MHGIALYSLAMYVSVPLPPCLLASVILSCPGFVHPPVGRYHGRAFMAPRRCLAPLRPPRRAAGLPCARTGGAGSAVLRPFAAHARAHIHPLMCHVHPRTTTKKPLLGRSCLSPAALWYACLPFRQRRGPRCLWLMPHHSNHELILCCPGHTKQSKREYRGQAAPAPSRPY